MLDLRRLSHMTWFSVHARPRWHHQAPRRA